MPFPEISLWLWTLLCVGGFALGMAIHLWLHPQGQHYSDALDLLRRYPALLWLALATASGAALASRSQADLPWLDWPRLAPLLGKEALLGWSRLLHQVNPLEATLYLTPLAIAAALWTLARRPYKCGLSRPLKPEQLALLVSLLVLTSSWVGLRVGSPEMLQAEWFATIDYGCRVLTTALLAALVQVWLFRVALVWTSPESEFSRRDLIGAWFATLGRWRRILGLTLFNCAWISLLIWRDLTPGSLAGWLAIEMLLLFSPLPASIALAPPQMSFREAGSHALQAWRRIALPVLMMSLTGIVMVALLVYAGGVGAALFEQAGVSGTPFRVIHAFLLAIVHNWLFLAAALMMLQRGFPENDPIPAEESAKQP